MNVFLFYKIPKLHFFMKRRKCCDAKDKKKRRLHIYFLDRKMRGRFCVLERPQLVADRCMLALSGRNVSTSPRKGPLFEMRRGWLPCRGSVQRLLCQSLSERWTLPPSGVGRVPVCLSTWLLRLLLPRPAGLLHLQTLLEWGQLSFANRRFPLFVSAVVRRSILWGIYVLLTYSGRNGNLYVVPDISSDCEEVYSSSSCWFGQILRHLGGFFALVQCVCR